MDFVDQISVVQYYVRSFGDDISSSSAGFS